MAKARVQNRLFQGGVESVVLKIVLFYASIGRLSLFLKESGPVLPLATDTYK